MRWQGTGQAACRLRSEPCVCEKLRTISRIVLIWCIGVTLLVGSAFRQVQWSYVDTAVNLSAAGDTRSWHEVLSDSLTKSAEYRPFLDVFTRLGYQAAGLNLGIYQGIVIVEFALILLALALMFRPDGWPRVTAAILALSIAVGLHTSRILFLFVPLNAYATSMLIVLTVTLLLMTPRLRGYEWVLLPLTLAGLLWLELAVLIVPLALVGWVMKAPGATWRSAAAAVAGLTIYLIARLGFAPSLMGSPETGFGFSSISPAESAARFGDAPWVLWLYNVGSTMLTVVASEPRAGRFQFVRALTLSDVPVWMWLHVLSSVATTAVVVVGLAGIRRRPHRDQVIAAFGGVLIVGGSALAFLYTRDRIGLPAGIGYAMVTYVAVSALLERVRSGRPFVPALVAALGLCWSIRSAEMYVALRDTAWDYRLEWDRGEAVSAGRQNQVIARMRQSALSHTPADAERDPRWTYILFERRFSPAAEEPGQ
ncbi:MAG TPA: hypothetical protein VFD64_05565 [Gemmatimonadaceae bacterium]|nr:hypothetical protein [Gemmatimonadaceae bacterium]